jgi:hypothetical protein
MLDHEVGVVIVPVTLDLTARMVREQLLNQVVVTTADPGVTIVVTAMIVESSIHQL